jgi:hypothetical protein
MAAPILDVLATPAGQGGDDGGVKPADGTEQEIPVVTTIPLPELTETRRAKRLERKESYFRASQDDHKRYDWDGRYAGYESESPVKPGYVVAYSQRRPCARYDVAKIVVYRLSARLFGSDRAPELRVAAHPDAEDWVKTAADVSRYWLRLLEARDYGGSEGTCTMSFKFSEGKPRIEVHNPRHATVLEWADEDMQVVKSAVVAYKFVKQKWDPVARKLVDRVFYYVRFWDQQREIIWPEVPKASAELPNWDRNTRKLEVKHGFGFCPFFWWQNNPRSDDDDGYGDYEGQESTLDEINQILSGNARGTKANQDPTPVIHEDPVVYGQSTVQKGSGHAIVAKGGASYLEISGASVEAGIKTVDRLKSAVLDVCGVVDALPDRISAAAQSAQAMRILYAPELAKCDTLREQYGDATVLILESIVRAAQILGDDQIELPDRVELGEPGEDGEPGEPTVTPRSVPVGEVHLTLNWPPYFAPTWHDIAEASKAAQDASGGSAIISKRTATAAIATMFGVDDIDAEMAAIAADRATAVEEAAEAMKSGVGPDGKPIPQKPQDGPSAKDKPGDGGEGS